MTERKVIYLETQNNIPVFTVKENVKVEQLDIIDKFKEKYTINELVVQQNNILSKLNRQIFDVKEVLVYLSQNQLNLNIDDNLMYDKFVNDVMVGSEDYDQYCTDIAEELAKEFKLLNINHLSELKDLNIPNYKKIMYTYLEKAFTFISNPKFRNIGFRHIDEPMNSFLFVFKLLLKVKEIFTMFFNILILDASIDILERIVINKFLLQYEFIISLDVFETVSRRHSSRYINEHGMDVYSNNFSSYITQSTQKVLDSIFMNSSQYLLKNSKALPFILFLETKYKKLNSKTHIYDFLENYYKDSIFLSYDNINNTYNYWYNDYMIDFSYVSSMVDGLEYTYYIDHSFIRNFLKIKV